MELYWYSMTKRSPRDIEKKVLAGYFDKIVAGEKTFELRLADWECRPGDHLVLVEIDPKTRQPTGRTVRRRVGYVGKTKSFDFWTENEVEAHGYQVISLLDDRPQIRIRAAWLLQESISRLTDEPRPPESVSRDWIAESVVEYQKAWRQQEAKIMLGMTEILGLSFRQNIIDIYIASGLGTFSDPMVISPRLEPDRFVDTLTHELLHRLLTDNTTISGRVQLLPEWRKLFDVQDRTRLMVVHIPVHAVHKAIYLDVLKAPKRLERDIDWSKRHETSDYIDAWDHVDQHGYQAIIDQLRRLYDRLGGP